MSEEQNKDLIVKSSSSVADYIPEDLSGYTGYEDFGQEDVVIPRFRVVQPTSQTGREGHFLCNLNGEELAEMSIAIIKAPKGRAMWWNEKTASDAVKSYRNELITATGKTSGWLISGDRDELLCRSYDFMAPDPNHPHPPSSICAKRIGTRLHQECPFGAWDETDDKPPCSANYNMLCIRLDDGLPFWLTVHGASIKPTKGYISSIILKRAPLFIFQTTISLEKRDQPQKHYRVKFAPAVKISEETARELVVPLVQSLKDVDIRRTFEAEQEAMTKDGGGEGEGGEEGGVIQEPPKDAPSFMKGAGKKGAKTQAGGSGQDDRPF